MAYILKDGDHCYIACFEKSSDSQVLVFLVTNFEEFFSEEVSFEQISERSLECGELRVKTDRLLSILKDQPSSYSITRVSGTKLRINLSFAVGNHQLQFYLLLDKCGVELISKHFVSGLVKLAMENSTMIDKLEKAVKAKDQEIDDYKKNGATLVRGK